MNRPEPKDFRFVMMLPRSMLDRIDDWRFSKRIATRATAVRELTLKGIHADTRENAAREFVLRHPALGAADIAEFEAYMNLAVAVSAMES